MNDLHHRIQALRQVPLDESAKEMANADAHREWATKRHTARQTLSGIIDRIVALLDEADAQEAILLQTDGGWDVTTNASKISLVVDPPRHAHADVYASEVIEGLDDAHDVATDILTSIGITTPPKASITILDQARHEVSNAESDMAAHLGKVLGMSDNAREPAPWAKPGKPFDWLAPPAPKHSLMHFLAQKKAVCYTRLTGAIRSIESEWNPDDTECDVYFGTEPEECYEYAAATAMTAAAKGLFGTIACIARIGAEKEQTYYFANLEVGK